MAQLVIRFFYLKYSIVVDFLLVYFGVWIHQFLDFNTVIDYEKRKYDTIFILTCLVLVSRIIINITVIRDKKIIENDLKKEELRKLKLDNDRKEIENEKLKRN